MVTKISVIKDYKYRGLFIILDTYGDSHKVLTFLNWLIETISLQRTKFIVPEVKNGGPNLSKILNMY